MFGSLTFLSYVLAVKLSWGAKSKFASNDVGLVYNSSTGAVFSGVIILLVFKFVGAIVLALASACAHALVPPQHMALKWRWTTIAMYICLVVYAMASEHGWWRDVALICNICVVMFFCSAFVTFFVFATSASWFLLCCSTLVTFVLQNLCRDCVVAYRDLSWFTVIYRDLP